MSRAACEERTCRGLPKHEPSEPIRREGCPHTEAQQLERVGRDAQRGHHVGQQIVGSIQEGADEPGIGLGVCTQSVRRAFE